MRLPSTALGLLFSCGLPGLITPGCAPRRTDAQTPETRPAAQPARQRRPVARRPGRPTAPASRSRGEIAATLNGRAILLADVTRRIPEATRKRIQAIPGVGPGSWALREAQLRTLKTMIEDRLLSAEAARRRIEASESDLQRAVTAVLRSSGIDRAQLVAALKASGKTLEQYRTELAAQIAIMRLLVREQSKVLFTDVTLKARYQAQRPNGTLFRHAKERLRRELTRERLLHRLRRRAQITILLKPLSRPQPAPSARLLDVPPLLDVKDIFRLLGSSGPFQVGRLLIPPRSATHDSLHFKAIGKRQEYDLAYRIWKLKGPALTRQFQALWKQLPKARLVNRVADRSLRTISPQVRGHAYLDRRAGAVVLLTCGTQLCLTETMILRVAKLLHKRLRTHASGSAK